MYKGLFGDKHKLAFVSLDNIQKHKFISTGIYERDVLCQKCDNEILGKLESYASRAFYRKYFANDDLLKSFNERDQVNLFKSITIESIEYTRFKLFLLSILWRAHISKHPFFKDIDLGKYADKIRMMILTNEPGGEEELQTMIAIAKSDKIPLQSVIMPRYLRFDGNSSYIFFINNIFYHFNLSQHNKLSIFDKGYIAKDNTMEIAYLIDSSAISHFDRFLGGKLRLREK